MLKGLLILLVFQCLGEIIKAYTQVFLPAPVIGMLLLFLALSLRGQSVPTPLNQTSQQLIRYLPLMFLPPAVGIFFLGPQFSDQWPAIIAAIVIGTFLSLLFNAILMKRLSRNHPQ
jgi:holin-like protein